MSITNKSASAAENNGPTPYAAYMGQILQEGILMGKKPVVTTNPNKLQDQAYEKMKREGYNYIQGGCSESATMDANRLAFRRWKLIPRILKPTTPRDMSVTLFGHKYRSCVFMAPIGCQDMMHDDKEVGVAQACAALDVPFTMSTASTSNIEEITAVVPDSPKWFQLYWPSDEEILASILKRVKDNGFHTLVVTLDTWSMSWRSSDLDTATAPFIVGVGDEVAFHDPVFRRKFAEKYDGDKPEENKIMAGIYWCDQVYTGVSKSWEDLKILRKYWSGPLVIKGLMSVHDARLAVEHGVEGIIISNHGGRQMDGGAGTLDVLPEIVDAVGNQTAVMIDSGFRTGADIVKALALGAKAVFVGRPVVYGLGINGKEGAQAVLAGLLADADVTMGTVGAQTVSELNRTMMMESRHTGDVRSNL